MTFNLKVALRIVAKKPAASVIVVLLPSLINETSDKDNPICGAQILAVMTLRILGLIETLI